MNSVTNGWKYRWKGILKAFFCHQKSNKKADMLCINFSSTSKKFHELEPKKMDIWLWWVHKTKYRFLVTSGCLLCRKVWRAVRISSFWWKINVFYWPEWTEVINLKKNFKHFLIQKWMIQAGRAEKVDEKNVVICVVFTFPSWVMILILSKKVHFPILCWSQQKHLSMLKQLHISFERSHYAHSENVIVHYPLT